jgi:amino-acid N-acetyltransferase
VDACLNEAGNLGIKDVFCFTYQPGFFKKHRFADVDKAELPRKVWTDCFRCPKFPNCDEIALIYHAEE